MTEHSEPLRYAAQYGQTYRSRTRNITPTATADELREGFCLPLPEVGEAGEDVIRKLVAAAEPGLLGNTDPNFFAWVMGGSDPVGVAADWLAAIWGQNAGIYQTSPAAAIAEEAVEGWLLELLDLPRDSSVGLVTGATMAAFVGLAAARTAVLARAGYDFEKMGLQGAPMVHVFMSDEAHITNSTALRHLGFGEANFHRLPSDTQGLLLTEELDRAMGSVDGPKIVIAQAGQINTGGFEDFRAISRIARAHGAWVHVDGAFGLWARASVETRDQTDGVDLADSWSVDGHKWLQIPYDSGFAIVRDRDAHIRSMETSAAYLNSSDGDGRNPCHYTPGLSRRARGFAAWAVLRGLGRSGVSEIVARHCTAARRLGERIAETEGLTVLNDVGLNQVLVGASSGDRVQALADRLNANHGTFVKTTVWRGQTVLRLSVISQGTQIAHVERLADAIAQVWAEAG